MFGYWNTIRQMTDGRGTFSMSFSHYDTVPRAPDPPDDLYPPAIGMRA